MEEEEGRLPRSTSEAQCFSPTFDSYPSHRVAKPTEKNSTNFRESIDFSSVRTTDHESSVEGQNRQLFTVVNRDLFVHNDQESEIPTPTELTWSPTQKEPILHGKDGDQGSNPVSLSSPEAEELFNPVLSMFSAEANELNCVPIGTYSIWRPKIVEERKAAAANTRSKKSSPWSGLGWKTSKLHNSLLRRTHREGKEDSILLPKQKEKSEQKGGKMEATVPLDAYEPSDELTLRLSFHKVFTTGICDEGRDLGLSSSSLGADERESVPGGRKSVWRRNAVDKSSPSRCHESDSTGNKHWKKLRDLLLRQGSSKTVESSESSGGSSCQPDRSSFG